MKLSQALALSATLVKTKGVLGQVFYADYATRTCLSDGNEPAWVLNSNMYEASIEACCGRFFDWTIIDECYCLETGGGTACTGTSEWYVDYENSICVQDCPEDGATCGGLASGTETLYASALECCEGKLTSIVPGQCEADSTAGTYLGSGLFYVDHVNTMCLQDCDAAGGAPCGGIILDTSVVLSADVATCCSDQLSYVNPDICAVLSDPAGVGTGKFYADAATSMCVYDHDTCPTGHTCARADASTGTLYDDAATCCAGGLSWVNPALCEALTTGTPSTKWFVDYANEVCVNDCASGDAWCVDITAMEALPVDVYDTSLACCEAKLPSIKPDVCDDLSNGLVPTGSLLWYVDYENDACVQDCDPSAAPTCGGLATSEDLHADVATCCAEKLPYLAADFCAGNSNLVPYTGSLGYYVDYANTMCLQDCDAAGGAPCGGIIEDSNTVVHADAATCCSEDLSFIDADLCAALSDPTSTGTGKFFPDAATGMCINDLDTCPTGYTCARADGTTGALYADEATCCAEGLPWVDPDYCVSLTTSVPTALWVADYANLVCVNDCVGAAPCADITTLDPAPTKFYATALECCEGSLSWTDSATCDAVSQIGIAAHVGTNKWYGGSSDGVCVQDCDAAGGVPCGGILPLGSSEVLYDTTADCCADKYGHIDPALCLAMSTDTFTDLFYVGDSESCAQDCDAAGGVPCGGHPTDLAADLYATVEECCATFSWLTEDECVSTSTGAAPVGSTEFYIDWTLEKCVQDCDAAGGAPCGGIKKAYTKTFTDSAACCDELTWIHPDDCVLA